MIWFATLIVATTDRIDDLVTEECPLFPQIGYFVDQENSWNLNLNKY